MRFDGNAAAQHAAAHTLDVEARKIDLDELVVVAEQCQGRVDLVELEVPLAHSLVAPAEPDRPVRHGGRS